MEPDTLVDVIRIVRDKRSGWVKYDPPITFKGPGMAQVFELPTGDKALVIIKTSKAFS